MKKCIIVVNTGKKESTSLGKQISKLLKQKDIRSDILNFNGYNSEYPFDQADFVITLGGDGTVLYAARGCAPRKIPIFPVNLGEFGFIASVQKNNWQTELDTFLNCSGIIVERSMIMAEVIRNSKTIYFDAGLNDIVISAKNALHTISFQVIYNHSTLGKFKSDGIIIATPTGSTAYSVSAGGPIVDPDVDAVILTPINSFSLSSRPLVLSAAGEIGIHLMDSRIPGAKITIDGQRPIDLLSGDFIIIKRSPYKALLYGCSSDKFYASLRSKLNWSGGPHA